MTSKKIIITGGATRIGAAIAKSLADYETTITIHYNKSKGNALKLKKELENLGSEVYLLKADLNPVLFLIIFSSSLLDCPSSLVNFSLDCFLFFFCSFDSILFK